MPEPPQEPRPVRDLVGTVLFDFDGQQPIIGTATFLELLSFFLNLHHHRL
jgi:hypothetical protein